MGIVIALEVTRLSRNSPDWHHLLYLCRFTGTLIADEHTIYDPDHATDRLVLGIRGQMSEMEIDTMIERMVSARWNKAARGELYTIPPAGYDLDRLGCVFQGTRFMFVATNRLQTQIVFSIGPVNPDKGSKLLFIQHLIHLSSPVQCVIPSYAGTCELEFCEAIIGGRFCGRP